MIAKPLAITYRPDKRVMFKIKNERTADCVVAGYRVHKSGDGAIGSLLLGLYKDDGTLASVGVIGTFPMANGGDYSPSCSRSSPPSMATRGIGQPMRPANAHPAGTKALAGTPARTSRSYRCNQSVWSRSATTTWKANGSATPPSSTAGAPTATHAHAPMRNLSSHSPSA